MPQPKLFQKYLIYATAKIFVSSGWLAKYLHLAKIFVSFGWLAGEKPVLGPYDHAIVSKALFITILDNLLIY